MNKTKYILTSANLKMPSMIYGTAWKKEKTTDLVVAAILAGFRGVGIKYFCFLLS